ncbi:MAG: glycosyltransferase family 2 protein [Candidatus Tectomicrobia bacterium]|nr:glycosyltransferase family 2 protein [Candidatus Tectomicrobia bacterium]
MRDIPRVSACVITYNEERNIEGCLESLKWCDEIIVVDSFSTDKTVELARRYTAKVRQHRLVSHPEQKNLAISCATHAWVLNVDADERVTPALAAEIQEALAANRGDIAGYLMPRRTYFLGHWFRHGAWYPDRKLRLFRRDRGRFGGVNPHDKVVLDGPTQLLRNDLLHYTYRDLSHNLATIDKYSDHFTAHATLHPLWPIPAMLVKPPLKFLETFIYKRGFLDGLPGFVVAVMNSFYIFLKYAKLWSRARRPSPPHTP